jgi:hypothetical protein
VHASSWDVFALCVELDRYSAFALNAGVPTAGINEARGGAGSRLMVRPKARSQRATQPIGMRCTRHNEHVFSVWGCNQVATAIQRSSDGSEHRSVLC